MCDNLREWNDVGEEEEETPVVDVPGALETLEDDHDECEENDEGEEEFRDVVDLAVDVSRLGVGLAGVHDSSGLTAPINDDARCRPCRQDSVGPECLVDGERGLVLLHITRRAQLLTLDDIGAGKGALEVVDTLVGRLYVDLGLQRNTTPPNKYTLCLQQQPKETATAVWNQLNANTTTILHSFNIFQENTAREDG